VPYFTITNIVQGKTEDPRVSTLQKLVDYFRARDSEAAEQKARAV
jgi:predicted transcriptional regulator